VAVLDLDTGEEKTVIGRGTNPAYLDTGHLVFVRAGTLMAVAFDAAELALIGEPVALVSGIRHSGLGPADYALSANGTLVYVPANTGEVPEAAVVWVDREGRILERAIPDPVSNPRDPRLSPDGQRLLLVMGPEADGDLWNFDMRGRPPIPLALPSNNQFPVWSPDGRAVAFLVVGSGVVTLASDGSERAPRPLHGENLGPHAWLPRGELILWSLAGDIVGTLAEPTAPVRNVVASDSAENDPALSPDGRWLAYVSNRSGESEIWVQGYPDGTPQRVSSNGGYEPLWSADGSELFYRQGEAVMAVAVETGAEFLFGAPQPLFSGPYVQSPGPGTRGYDVARDGRFLMILPEAENVAATLSGIVVVQNFGEEIRQRVRPSAR
jgi:serine/threonine-protein kinase